MSLLCAGGNLELLRVATVLLHQRLALVLVEVQSADRDRSAYRWHQLDKYYRPGPLKVLEVDGYNEYVAMKIEYTDRVSR